MKKLKTIFILSILLATSFFIMIPLASYATTPAAYVDVTLKNSQTTATPANFSQMLKVNWSLYASDLNANVSNVRFYTSSSFTSGSELAGWIETNNTTTATSSTVWVNLSSDIIPASGSITIYMAFLPTTASWSSHWGLSPLLSTVYGMGDNGQNVFTFYDNFAGTTLSSKWQEILSGSGTYTVNNGITIVGDSGASYAAHLVTKSTYAPGILEAYVTVDTTTLNGNGLAYDTVLPTTTGGDNGFQTDYRFDTISSPDARIVKDVSGSGSVVAQVAKSPSLPALIGAVWPATGNEIQTWNYTSIMSGTDTAIAYTNSYLDVYAIGGSSASATISAYYIRLRAYPPAGVMPSVTFGTVTKIVTSGYQISFQQTSLPSGTRWGIRLNNTTAIIWQNSTAQFNNLTGLAAGTYTYQVINATGYASNPYSGLLTIVSTNLTQSIVFTGYSIAFVESGLPSGYKWYVNLTDQSGLSESTAGQKISGTAETLYAYEPNGSYTFTYQSLNKKYSGGLSSFIVNGGSVTNTLTFSPVLFYLNFTASGKPSAVEWGINLSGTIKTSNSNLISFQLQNGTYFWNASAINGSFNNPEGWWRLTNGSGMVLLHNESSFTGMKITINGANYANTITFQRAYNITFEEVGIGIGYTWDANLSNGINGLGVILDKSIIVTKNLNQVYFPSIEGNYTNASYTGFIQVIIYGPTDTKYINYTGRQTTAAVNGKNLIVVYNFLTQYYLTTSSNPVGGGYHSPYSGWYNASTQVQLSARSNSSYQFTGFQGTNTSSYTGFGYYSSGDYLASITMTNPITEIMDFNNYVVLTFFMQNLTTGTKWGIKLSDTNGVLQWTNVTGTYIVMDLAQGTYTYLVTGVQATPQTNSITISTSTEVLLQYNVSTYDVNFKEAGLPSGTDWTIVSFTSTYSVTVSGSSSTLNFELPNGSFSYFAKSVYGYVTNNSSGSFNVSGRGQSLYINWTEGNAFTLEGVRNFVQISINTTDYSISAGTQIPITMDWKRYSAYENNNLSNVLFMNNTFYPLNAWIESGASSSSANSQVWVKIEQNIPTYSSLIFYVTWQTPNRNNLNKYGYLGEAPQLSPQYGEYNNIAEVMNPGLLEQIYTNTSLASLNSLSPYSLYNNTSFNKGSYILNGTERYYANQNYFITQSTGSTQEVYQDSGTTYVPYGLENNTLISYQTQAGNYPGSWPSPPIASSSSSQTWFAKVAGFVQMNVANTIWYSMDDDGSYLSIGNTNHYLTSGWASQNTILTTGGAIGENTPILSGTSIIQGTAQFQMQYEEVKSGQAIWQFWSNQPVTYWHPIPIQGFNASSQISFGPVVSSQSSFYEYGLPANTNWSVAISGPGFSKLYTTNSNLIYTYLPNGTYIYTIGSMVNGSYHSGIDGNFIPSPSTGHVIVTGTFTSQVIIFSINQVLEYNLVPEQASGVANNVTLPILAVNIKGLPAGNATISNIISHLTAKLISKNESQNQNLTWTLSSSRYGMIVIFLHIGKVQIKEIKAGSAVVSFVAAFQLGTISEIAAGVAGPSTFAQLNTSSPSSPSPPLGLNTSSPSSFLNSLNGPLTTLFGNGTIIIHLTEVATILISVLASYYLERIRRMHEEAKKHIRKIRKGGKK